LSDDAKLNANGQHAPGKDKTFDSELLESTLEMTNAVGEIQSALEVLQRHIGVIAAWSSERHDVSDSTRDLGAILLGASQAALDQRAEIESERERILASARQMAQAIISEAEARARSIVGDARSVPVREESRTTTVPRVDATLVMTKIAPATEPTEATRSSTSNSAAANVGPTFGAAPEESPRPDPTLIMPKVTPTRDPGEADIPPRSSATRPSRAADLLATLDQITEANASLADNIAAVAEH